MLNTVYNYNDNDGDGWRRRHQLQSWPHLYELYRYCRFSNTAATDDNQFIRLHLHFNSRWWLNYYFYSTAVREKNSTRNTPMYRHNRLNDNHINNSRKIYSILNTQTNRFWQSCQSILHCKKFASTQLNDTIETILIEIKFLFNKLDLTLGWDNLNVLWNAAGN